jgi:CheY-like chemotaxis protein
MRVLVVDDSDISRQFIAEALLRIGINPDIVTDGHQCIQKIRLAEDERSPYDLVLLDWKMPDIDGIEVASIIRQGSLAVQPNIVLLSSYDIDDLKELGKPLHINNYLEKPLSSSALFDCITQLKGVRQTIHTTQDSNQKLSKFDGRGKRILLVEDNALNQKVAIGYLKETHADIDVASNGKEAIDLLQSERFDVVLMDIQMPVMDGLTATTLIRKKLKSKIPIIAMTAHAMVGDVDKSLAVGMNAHIVKPIEPDTLFKVLDEIVNQNKTRSVERKGKVLPKPHTLGTQSLISIDKEQAIRALNHEPQLYDELVVEFLDLEAQAQQLKQALSKQDINEIKRIVHAYKPPLSYIGAYSLAVYTSELETMLSRESAPLSQDTQCRVHDFLDALAAITEKLKVKK